MPKKRSKAKKVIHGNGFLDWIKGAANTVNKGLKNSKIISTLAPVLPIPYASQIGNIARNVGYGAQAGGRKYKNMYKK